jgi:hypothetical protein
VAINPYDPSCGRFAADMDELDFSWPESRNELDATNERDRRKARRLYVIQNEGTFNRENGHFLCDKCYIQAGSPTARGGWICP